jgi:hypothetical protein
MAVGYKFGDRVKLGLTANLLHSDSDRGLTNNDNTGTSDYFVLSATPNFIDLRPQNGVYPSNLAVTTNPLQTVALLQNHEELTRLISGTTATVDAYSSPDNEQNVKVLGNVGIDTFSQKNNVLSPPGLAFEPDDKLLGTVVDGTTTNTNFNVGTSAVWMYTPQSRLLRSALRHQPGRHRCSRHCGGSAHCLRGGQVHAREPRARRPLLPAGGKWRVRRHPLRPRPDLPA